MSQKVHCDYPLVLYDVIDVKLCNENEHTDITCAGKIVIVIVIEKLEDNMTTSKRLICRIQIGVHVSMDQF